MPHFTCKEVCLLRDILNSITRRLKFNCELIAGLADLHYNQPRRLHKVVAKLQIVNDIQKEKLEDAQHLIFCLENGCDVCFPDGGVNYESDAAPDDSGDSNIANDSDITDDSDDTDISEEFETIEKNDDDQKIEIE